MSKGRNIIKILMKEKPTFQLDSTQKVIRSSEQFLTRPRRTDDIPRFSHASSIKSLRYMAEVLDENAISIETGGGWSTCVLATRCKTHICINPDLTANEAIGAFLSAHGFNNHDLRFIGQPSDTALPSLDQGVQFDAALIDGNHSFPIPIIDWHYMDIHLREGGLFFIDDTHIRPAALVAEFMMKDSAYKFIKDIGSLKVFMKTCEHSWGWKGQKFNFPDEKARD